MADNFRDAEIGASDIVLPMLSWLAFTTDTAVDAVAVVLSEESSGAVQTIVTLPGQVKSLPSGQPMLSHPDMEKYFSAYREGLTSNSPLYQAVAFHKLIEGIRSFATRRARDTGETNYKPEKNGLLTTFHIPRAETDLPYKTPWELEPFRPYLGKSFEKVYTATIHLARNAALHINPGQELRVADYVSDTNTCREAAPVLRHMARILIEHELARVTGDGIQPEHPEPLEEQPDQKLVSTPLEGD